jgi:putative proteasome-type protease
MTYCVAIRLDEGMVFLSDCRTHAGVDNIATFRKMAVWEPGDRVLVLLTAGNLAVSQATLNLLNRGLEEGKDKLLAAPDMFEAARRVGAAVREVYREDGAAMRAQGNDFNVTLALGGQIGQQEPQLFQIYAAGNFIEATSDTPYFQMGETKYGKPILDRIIRPETTLKAAAKCALISMDSTLRSNLSVGLPLDLAIYRRDSLKLEVQRHIDESDRYFQTLGQRWQEGLRSVFKQLPDPDWLG